MNPTYKGSIELLRDFWENRSTSFEKDYGIRQKGVARLAREIARFIEGRTVLELGCGPGIVASAYPEDADVLGLDFSSAMLRRAKRRIKKLVLGDSLNLPFCKETFQIVTCFFMASDYASKEYIFLEAYRVLETGGLFLYADYSPSDEHWRLRQEIRHVLGESCDIHIEGEQELSEKLKHVGLCVLRTKLFRFPAEFRLERYTKSRIEMQRLRRVNPYLWNRLKVCTEKDKIEREFILLTCKKQQDRAR